MIATEWELKNLKGIVYFIINKVNNKIYVGSSINNFYYRYGNHWAKNTTNKHLKRSAKKYGIKNFYITIIDYNIPDEFLFKNEDMYIALFDTMNPEFGYNKMIGRKNCRFSEETKRKLSKSKMGKYVGKNNPFYGKHHTNKTRKIISDVSNNRKKKTYYFLSPNKIIFKIIGLKNFCKEFNLDYFSMIKMNNKKIGYDKYKGWKKDNDNDKYDIIKDYSKLNERG